MNINAINSAAGGIAPLSQTGAAERTAGASSEGSFGSLVKSAVESIEGTQKSAESEIARAVSGESPDLHKTIIALQQAELKFQFGLQVRNKLIGAYEEIMRMQV